MGFIRKLTGVQGQIDAANKNADAQVNATKQAAQAQTAALNASAKAAADAQRMQAERNRAELLVADSASTPLGMADVALDPEASGSAAGGRRGKRAQFGKGPRSSTGVNI